MRMKYLHSLVAGLLCMQAPALVQAEIEEQAGRAASDAPEQQGGEIRYKLHGNHLIPAAAIIERLGEHPEYAASTEGLFKIRQMIAELYQAAGFNGVAVGVPVTGADGVIEIAIFEDDVRPVDADAAPVVDTQAARVVAADEQIPAVAWVEAGWDQLGKQSNDQQIDEALKQWQLGVDQLPAEQLLAFAGVYRQLPDAVKQLRRIGRAQQAFIVSAPFRGGEAYYVMSARQVPADHGQRATALASLAEAIGNGAMVSANAAARFQAAALSQAGDEPEVSQSAEKPAAEATATVQPPVAAADKPAVDLPAKQPVVARDVIKTEQPSSSRAVAGRGDWIQRGWQLVADHQIERAIAVWQQGVNTLPSDRLLAFLGVYERLPLAEQALLRVGPSEQAILLRATLKGKTAIYLLSASDVPADKSMRRERLASLYRKMNEPAVIYANAAAKFQTAAMAGAQAAAETVTALSDTLPSGDSAPSRQPDHVSEPVVTTVRTEPADVTVSAAGDEQGPEPASAGTGRVEAAAENRQKNSVPAAVASLPQNVQPVAEAEYQFADTSAATSPDWVAAGWERLIAKETDAALAIWQQGVNRLPADRLLAFVGVYTQLSAALRAARRGGLAERLIIVRADFRDGQAYYVLSARDVPVDKAVRREKLASLMQMMHISGTLYANAASKFQTEAVTVPAPAISDETFTIRAFSVAGNTLIADEEIRDTLAPYTGDHKTREDLVAAKQAILRLYRDAGYEMIAVGLPRTIDSETIPVRIFEARIGEVRVSGATHTSEKRIRSALSALKSGQTANADALDEQLRNLAGQQNIKSTQLIYHPTDTGAIDVEIGVDAENPMKFGLMASSLGTQETGQNLLTGILHHNNVWNEGHELTLSYTLSEKPQNLQLFSALYMIPLEELGGKLMLSFSRANIISGQIQGVLNSSGNGTLKSIHYEQTLLRKGGARHFLEFGLEQHRFLERFGNVVLPAAFSVGILARPVVVGYGIERELEQGKFAVRLGYYHNTPVGTQKALASYQLLNPAAVANWSLVRMSADYQHDWSNGWSFSGKLGGQYSNNALISGERFYITGLAKVRGFEEVEASGDSAYFLRSELISPNWVQDTRFHAFVDAGRYKLNFPFPGEFGTGTIVSTGLGVHWTPAFGLDLLGEAGIVLNGLPVAPRGSMTGHFKVVYWFQ